MGWRALLCYAYVCAIVLIYVSYVAEDISIWSTLIFLGIQLLKSFMHLCYPVRCLIHLNESFCSELGVSAQLLLSFHIYVPLSHKEFFLLRVLIA